MRRVLIGIAVIVIASLAQAAPAVAGGACTIPGAADPTFTAQSEFEGTFSATRQGDFVQIPFAVGAGTTAIRVRYCFDQPPSGSGNTLDMGVYEPLKSGDTVWGPRERRGWSGSAVRDLAISVNGFTSDDVYLQAKKAYVSGNTTRAYQPGPVPAGEWAVELGLAAIAQPPADPDGIAWRVRVETTDDTSWSDQPYSPVPYDPATVSQEPGWYMGDFHAHGEEEPGNATMKQTFDYGFKPLAAGGAGLDFMTLVDHNNDVAHVGEIGRHQPDYPDNLIIPGTEVTTYKGHYNNQGSTSFADFRGGAVYRFEPSDSSLTKTQDAVAPATQFGPIRAAGGWTQLNHPTIYPSSTPGFAALCRGCPWDWPDSDTDYSQVDAIEIQTGPADLGSAPNPFSATAIAFYEDVLAGGHHVAAVGSSDSHQADSFDITSSPIGRGATVVHAAALSRAAIVAGVRADHTYVKPYGSDGPDIRLTGTAPGAPEAIIGDSLEGPVASFEARVTGAGPGAARPGSYLMKLLRNGAEVASVPVVGDDFTHTFSADSSGRFSLEILRENATADRVEAYSSPIWFTRVAPSNRVSLGGLERNLGAGTGLLAVKVPGPGRLALTGERVKAVSRKAGAAATIKLPVRAKGRALRALKRDGSAKVRVRIRFAPDYGRARSVGRSLTLSRR